jgi:PII-like signaling protein
MVDCYEWLLRRTREMGIAGGAAFREIAGYGRHDRLHQQSFFELAGDLPVELAFAMTQSDSQKFLDLLYPYFISEVPASSAV